MITDVNDSPPIFQFKNYHGEVEENSPSGTEVIVLEAYDPDEKTPMGVMKAQIQLSRSP